MEDYVVRKQLTNIGNEYRIKTVIFSGVFMIFQILFFFVLFFFIRRLIQKIFSKIIIRKIQKN